MTKLRMRRAWAVAASVAIAVGVSPILFAGNASAAGAVTVSTESEFWAAWTDSTTTQIDLAASIDLHADNGNGSCNTDTLPDRTPDGPTLVDGHGFTLRQLCEPNTVLYTFGSQPLTVQNITITHPAGVDGTGIFNANGDVIVINSTITGNNAGDNLCLLSDSVNAAYLCSSWGGGVFAGGAATITNSTITENSAQDNTAMGGGVFSDDFLTITNSTIAGNEALGQSYAFGGGAFGNDGSLIQGSTFTDNVAYCPGDCTPSGGGIAVQGGDTEITGSSFLGNSAFCISACGNVGGGIFTGSGSLTLTGSTVSQNGVSCEDACEADGAGIFASTDWIIDSAGEPVATNEIHSAGRGYLVAITDSTISDNVAATTDTPGGDCDCSGGGAVINGHESLTVTRSTFSNNAAMWEGGAVDVWNVEGTQVRIENSTVTGNRQAFGSAVDAYGSLVTTVYSTFDGNIVTEPPLEPLAAERYGSHGDVQAAIAEVSANLSAGQLTTFGTVFADPQGGSNCLINEGGTISEGYNFSDDASCGLAEATDQQSAGSPMLNVLGENGGPTATMMPYTPKTNGAASPLIDAIPVAACQTGVASGVGIDQRGVARPQILGCDIGAVEVTDGEYQVEAAVVTPKFTG